MIAFSVAQGMTQGVLPLVAYNYASGSWKRMTSVIRTTLGCTLAMACTATATLFLFAGPITAALSTTPPRWPMAGISSG